MKISQEDVILIKNLYLSKQYGACKLLSELPDKGWKLGSCWSTEENPQYRYNCLATRQAVDHVRRVAVEDLMLSQEDKPKKH